MNDRQPQPPVSGATLFLIAVTAALVLTACAGARDLPLPDPDDNRDRLTEERLQEKIGYYHNASIDTSYHRRLHQLLGIQIDISDRDRYARANSGVCIYLYLEATDRIRAALILDGRVEAKKIHDGQLRDSVALLLDEQRQTSLIPPIFGVASAERLQLSWSGDELHVQRYSSGSPFFMFLPLFATDFLTSGRYSRVEKGGIVCRRAD